MKHESEENGIDRAATLLLTNFSQRFSRRSVLVRAGRIAFSILGVSVIPLLPVDRIVPTAQAQDDGPDCHKWQLCGMWGRLCRACRCCGTTQQFCPGCTYQGSSYWATCCPVRTASGEPTGEYRNVKYTDCCGQQGTVEANGDSHSCDSGPFCHGNGYDPPESQISWCGGAPGGFRCTHWQVLGVCYP
jgi:hypothetical protein